MAKAERSFDAGAPLDFSEALARLRGDHDLLLDLIRFFLADWPTLRDSLREALAAQDRSVVERVGHSIKGLAANLDASQVVELAKSVEVTALKDPWDVLSARIDTLEQAGAMIVGRLEAYLATHSAN
ncbi:aerobic respiration control sensor protein ArcB [Pirellulimonas nuda]|uniref:Aerobic respiration control sensor protein ArcB n=1 Tax=Pirellulimonas nuda TaxID=2528009 RepID=A0A518D9X2_9BACT|nr:Hpt domain-containing protein [Pirellulimonas nuda]QDU88287.1 aerobic respiration control sensor protein ArcB [Pirellulimonas nuda]